MSTSAAWTGMIELAGTPIPPSSFGWTPIPPLYTGPNPDQIVYVSATGNDANVGTSEAAPKRTIGAALVMIRDGHGDRMLLKKGDTFTHGGGSVNVLGNWTGSGPRNGVDSSRPIIIGAYGSGTERPLIQTGTTEFIGNNLDFHDVWFIGLEITGHTYNGTTFTRGFNLIHSATNILIEDCYVHNYTYCTVFQAFPLPGNRHTNIRMRGSVMADAWYLAQDDPSSGINCQGIYAEAVDTLWVESTHFVMCGWNNLVPGSGDNGRRRGIYIQAGDIHGCTDTHIIDSTFTETDGIQARVGGEVRGCLLSQVKTGITLGYSYDPTTSGVSFNCDDNVLLESKASNWEEALNPVNVSNITGASTFNGNIVAHTLGNENTEDIRSFEIRSFTPEAPHPDPWPIILQSSLEFRDNIFYFAGKFVTGYVNAGQYSGGSLTLEDNEFQSDGSILGSDQPFGFANTTVTALIDAEGNTWSAVGGSPNWFGVSGAPYDGAPYFGSLDPATWALEVGDTTQSTTATTYVDPNRTLATYYTSIGHVDLGSSAANHRAMCDLFRDQSRDTWDENLTAQSICEYIREGFTPV